MPDIRFLLSAKYAQSYALVIGIDSYKEASPLSYAVSDAVAVRDKLVTAFSFPEDNVILLQNEEATKDAILHALFRYSQNDIGVDDRIIVFFAGHGATLTGYRGEVGHLIPQDAIIDDYSTYIRWDALTRGSELFKSKHVFFIMDACYGGLALTRTLQPGSQRFLNDMLLRYSRQVLTAGKADEVVADSGGPLPDHSVFTGHLLEALDGKAQTSEGVLTANGVMGYVYAKVANDRDSNQTPHYGFLDGDGDFVFSAPNLDGTPDEEENQRVDLLVSTLVPEELADLTPTEDLLAYAKSLIATEHGTIELHDLVVDRVRAFLIASSSANFPGNGSFSTDELVERMGRYESSIADLSLLSATLAYWARGIHLSTLAKAFSRSSDQLGLASGLVIWVALRWYPMVLMTYSAGIASIDSGRLESLAAILRTDAPITDSANRKEPFVRALGKGISELSQASVFKSLPGHERHHVPMSEYLLKYLQPGLDDALYLGKKYEDAFDTFEVYLALAVATERIAAGGDAWGPLGRFGWKHVHSQRGPFREVVNELAAQGKNWPPFKAGIFGSNLEPLLQAAEAYKSVVDGLNWL